MKKSETVRTEESQAKGRLLDIAARYAENKMALVGLLIIVVIAFFAAFAGFFGSYEDSITLDIMHKLQPPSAEHWFGTDTLGRDLFLRCIYGARISLIIGLASSFCSLIVGGLLGMSAGYYGGTYEAVVMRMLDIFSAIPTTLLAICIVAALGGSSINIVIALALSRVPAFARIARSSVLGVVGQEYVEAARSGGARDLRILLRHILPNMLGPIMVQTTTTVAQNILQIASLSFLGLGIPAPTPEWGAIITEAKGVMRMYPHMIWIPGICIMATSFSINRIGDGLRDALDPRLKS